MPLNWDDDGGVGAYLDLPWSAHNAETGVLSVNARTSRNAGKSIIQPGTHTMIDYGVLFSAWMRFQPKFLSIACPIHEGTPPQPAGGDCKLGVQFQFMIESVGMTFFSTTSTFNINVFNRLIAGYRRNPQAIAGQLPIYRLLPSEDISWGDGLFRPIALELVGWSERDEDVFGPRLVPPPRGRTAPTVVGFTPPKSLTGGVAEAVPAAPAVPFDGGVPVTAAVPKMAASPLPSVPHEQGAAPTGPIADPFAIFRRASNAPTPAPLPPTNPAA